MLIKIESIRCPDVTGLMSGCLRNCRPDTPEYADSYSLAAFNGKKIKIKLSLKGGEENSRI